MWVAPRTVIYTTGAAAKKGGVSAGEPAAGQSPGLLHASATAPKSPAPARLAVHAAHVSQLNGAGRACPFSIRDHPIFSLPPTTAAGRVSPPPLWRAHAPHIHSRPMGRPAKQLLGWLLAARRQAAPWASGNPNHLPSIHNAMAAGAQLVALRPPGPSGTGAPAQAPRHGPGHMPGGAMAVATGERRRVIVMGTAHVWHQHADANHACPCTTQLHLFFLALILAHDFA